MIGLGSYAFFWQQSDKNERPLSLEGAFDATKDLGIQLFQICDYAPLMAMTKEQLHFAAAHAKKLGLTLELGTKGIEPDHLEKFLNLASIFDAKLVRSMVHSQTSKPNQGQASDWLAVSMPMYEEAGVTLALETYEQISTEDLVKLIDQNGSPNLGICLDPANVVARFENPKHCIDIAAPKVMNIHVKDFAFTRQEGWVGFNFTGAQMGTGSHDYKYLVDRVQPQKNGINEIVEHWLPWQGTIEQTVAIEKSWTNKTIEYLRSTK